MAKRKIERPAQQEDEGVGSFVVGAFVGALVGAVSALWFAPRSGRETRQAIQERGVELRDELETAADEARKRIEGESLDESIQAGKAEARRFHTASG